MTDKSVHRQKSDRRDGDRRKNDMPVKVERRKAFERRTVGDRRLTKS
ncbi:MAG: hypothetical protein HN995_05005 [Candidatus Marinimicrobia bacterium]|jgi:hypothetical protein|nr:hypothetical protein [Candidatus Neomarinimicrobiota bacterium]MBT3574426.1 hypothetical protein [Candidatus Neomarinimicrobiota bacterium]MBT4253670.1 hypothetical protein [Candidatus Neomarinimicrobiota bacterium]MBT4480804.1 hypothetical protein [Candidatus Neomarinimicrobiota bacterium]MBT5236215.1 hypothetical protein [Candidatus Neomarinimicrobiota bacterium]